MPGIDKKEFIEIFDRLYNPVRSFIYYHSGDADLSDDIAQDTFTKIWEKRETIKPETVKSLAYTIASNLCKNNFGHRKVVLEFSSNYRPHEFSSSPEFEIEMNEFDEKLKNAINGLNEKNRVVFLMNRIDNMTYNEIAQNLGLTVKAIEKRMKNALDELKKTIEFKL